MIVEIATGDARAAIVMAVMIVLGVGLRFTQEARASDAAAKLRAMIRVTATVLRDGKPREVPLGELVPGRRRPARGRRHDPGRRPHPRLPRPLRHAGEPHRRIAPGREVRSSATRARSTSRSSSRTSASSAPASRAARPARWSSRPARAPTSARWRARSRSPSPDRVRPGRRALHLADDPLHRRHGAAGLRDQRPHEARLEGGVLLRPRRRRRAHARDAADDRLGVPLAGRARDVAQEGDREAPQLDPEPRRDGRPLHRQDRHAHAGPRHPRAPLRRGAATRTTACSRSRT